MFAGCFVSIETFLSLFCELFLGKCSSVHLLFEEGDHNESSLRMISTDSFLNGHQISLHYSVNKHSVTIKTCAKSIDVYPSFLASAKI